MWASRAFPDWIDRLAQVSAPVIDISSHISRPLTIDQIRSVDLIIGLAREHVRDAALLCPDAVSRMFTLKEIVRRSGDVMGPGNSETLESWLGRLAADRTLDSLLGDSPIDDIIDPIGLPVSEYRDTAAEISQLTTSLAASLALLD